VTGPDAVLAAVQLARATLEAQVDRVDDLNVFPVADGDTGANMLFTVRAVEDSAAATTGLPRADRCAALVQAALMGARGNSGMILSQIVRGAADALAAGEGAPDGAGIARALRAASDAAYAAVSHPVEGTMLTVARRAAGAAEASAGSAGAVLEAAHAGARVGVEEGPDLLPVLREQGVYDAGGVGVALLLEGVLAAVTGRAPRDPFRVATTRPPTVDHPPSRYRYCTSFVVQGPAIDLSALEAAVAPLGDSILVMGDERRARVHVHTDAPERAAAAAGAWGAVDALTAEDMRRQEAARTARLAREQEPAGCAALALLEGDGAHAIAQGLGARTLSPDAASEEIAAVLGARPEGEWVVVTADPAAAEAARAAAATVIEADSLPALLACLVVLDPEEGADANAEAMREAAEAVRAAAVEGAGPADLRAGAERALAPLLDGGPALVTILIGADAGVEPPEVEGWVRALAAGGDVEVEAHHGGQPAPALAIGVE
jgi:DAK2 domain fusion protein YloV